MSRLADLAKHLVVPSTAATTAWPSVRDTCRNLGWDFDEWQDDLGRLLLAKNADGLYAADMVVMSLPRQVGKTYLVGCVAFAVCLIRPGTKVIWTAHRYRTAAETFRTMKAKAKSPELSPFIDQRPKGGGIRSANGEQEIEFLNGSRILFGAREGGFGVGMAAVDMLVLDEIQRATTKAMDDLLPTANAAPNPLILCMGTPPRPTDPGEVFTLLRQGAIAGGADDVLYVELGARSRFDLNDEARFWEQVGVVNPAYPHRVGRRAILRNRKGLTAESVYREVFGLWDELESRSAVIKAAAWAALIDVGPAPAVRPAGIGVDASHDRHFSIGACWTEGESRHLEEVWAGPDEAACAEWVATVVDRRTPIVIDNASPAASLIPVLRARGRKVIPGTAGTMSQACGGWLSDANAARLTHADQEPVNDAVAGARKRPIGSAGGWGWDRKDAGVNIAPLVAVTLARHAAMTSKAGQKQPGMRVGNERRATVW